MNDWNSINVRKMPPLENRITSWLFASEVRWSVHLNADSLSVYFHEGIQMVANQHGYFFFWLKTNVGKFTNRTILQC